MADTKKWNRAKSPERMREMIPEGCRSARKLRLYSVACCRRIMHLIVQEEMRASVLYGEEMADNSHDASRHEAVLSAADKALSLMAGASCIARGELEDLVEMSIPREPAQAVYELVMQSGVPMDGAFHAAEAATNPSDEEPESSANAELTAAWAAAADESESTEQSERKVQCQLLRDIFGNPFEPLELDPAIINEEMKTLARGMYDQRDFSQMGELKQLLVSAGCETDEIIRHCDSPVHVRGCWLVDQILER